MSHKDLHKPFYLKNGSNIGVLCIHGLFGSPNQFIDIAKVIETLGYDVKAILLPGHGGGCKDFAKSSYKDWKEYAKVEIEKMQQHYDKVFLVGHSMGGLFCLDFADEVQADGVILINTPMKVHVKLEKIFMCMKVVFMNNTITSVFETENPKPLYSVDNGRWYEYITWIAPMLGIYKLIEYGKKPLISSVRTQ
ncbi:MAG: hypothetical protein BEN19_00230 [Epulopiscium sp. Nuni2H_MBin003]|nr:MAG: hypothetical protein BEN19_00230 [Epulopiscium sp. Nuni2H_MBin003]